MPRGREEKRDVEMEWEECYEKEYAESISGSTDDLIDV